MCHVSSIGAGLTGVPMKGALVSMVVFLHMKDTTSIGTASVGMLLGALLKSGYKVLVPFGEHKEYDLVLEKNGEFQSVQCKTGEIISEVVKFRTYTVVKKLGGGYTRRSYNNTVDYYGVYCPGNEQCYLVPARGTPTSMMNLRLFPPKNSQQKKIRWAKDYLL